MEQKRGSLLRNIDLKQYGILLALVLLTIAFTFVYYFKEGDFTFIMGCPARTSRQRTSFYARNHRDNILPTQVERYLSAVKQLEKRSAESEETRLRNLSRLKGINNGLKNYQGKVEWLRKNKVVEAMQADEAELLAFIQKRPTLKKRCGNPFKDLEKIFDRIHVFSIEDPEINKHVPQRTITTVTVKTPEPLLEVYHALGSLVNSLNFKIRKSFGNSHTYSFCKNIARALKMKAFL